MRFEISVIVEFVLYIVFSAICRKFSQKISLAIFSSYIVSSTCCFSGAIFSPGFFGNRRSKDLRARIRVRYRGLRDEIEKCARARFVCMLVYSPCDCCRPWDLGPMPPYRRSSAVT